MEMEKVVLECEEHLEADLAQWALVLVCEMVKCLLAQLEHLERLERLEMKVVMQEVHLG